MAIIIDINYGPRVKKILFKTAPQNMTDFERTVRDKITDIGKGEHVTFVYVDREGSSVDLMDDDDLTIFLEEFASDPKKVLVIRDNYPLSVYQGPSRASIASPTPPPPTPANQLNSPPAPSPSPTPPTPPSPSGATAPAPPPVTQPARQPTPPPAAPPPVAAQPPPPVQALPPLVSPPPASPPIALSSPSPSNSFPLRVDSTVPKQSSPKHRKKEATSPPPSPVLSATQAPHHANGHHHNTRPVSPQQSPPQVAKQQQAQTNNQQIQSSSVAQLMSQQTLQPGNLWGGELTPSTAQPLKDGQAQQRNASPTPQNAARPTSPNASASGVWGGQPTTNYTANLPNGSSNGTNPGHASRPSQGATPDLAKAQMQFAETLKKQELESRLRQQAAAAQGGTPAPQNQNSQPPNGYHSPPLGGSQTELNKHNKTNSTGAPPPTQPGFEYRNPKSQRLTSRVVGPVMPPPQPAAPPPPTSSPPPPPTTAPPPTPAPQTTAAPRILVVTVAYRPQNPDELELKQGERLREDRWFDDGWSFGTNLLTGKSGFFPQEFVVSAPTPPPPSATSGAGARAAAQELKASGIAAMGPSPPKTNGQQQPQPPLAAGAPPVPPKAGPGPVPTGPPAVGGLTGGFGGGGGASNVPVSVRLGSKQVPVPAPAAPEKQAAAPSAPLFQCVMAYKAAQSDELDLRVGDRVREDKRYDDGWSYGTNLESGKRGFYPQEFFAPFGGNSQAAPAKPQPSTYPPPLPPVNTSAGNGPGPTSPQYDGQSLVESAPYSFTKSLTLQAGPPAPPKPTKETGGIGGFFNKWGKG